MAKKKVIVETVETEALPEITAENADDIKEAKPKKRSAKKAIEVPAEEVMAIDSEGGATPLTEVAPETEGEIVSVDTDAAIEQSFIEDVSKVEDILPEKIEEDKPAEVKPAKAKKPKANKPKADKPKKATSEICIDKPVWCYPTAVANKYTKAISGTVYLWDKTPSAGRYAITQKPDGAGKLSALCGWVNAEDLGL